MLSTKEKPIDIFPPNYDKKKILFKKAKKIFVEKFAHANLYSPIKI